MEYFNVQLDDLPDEILLIIFEKMSDVEVLYSLTDVNQRLNKIVYDPVSTSHLTFSKGFSNDSISPLSIPMLDRFLFQILLKFMIKSNGLNLATSFIECILLFPKSPNLYRLDLYDLKIECAKQLFIDETSLIHKYKNQISSFVVDITRNPKQRSIKDVLKLIFTHLLTKFTNLQYFNFCPNSTTYDQSTFEMSPRTVISSTLLELHVYLEDITDCFCLLDGRFNQLHTLYVKIYFISSSSLTISNKVNSFD